MIAALIINVILKCHFIVVYFNLDTFGHWRGQADCCVNMLDVARQRWQADDCWLLLAGKIVIAIVGGSNCWCHRCREPSSQAVVRAIVRGSHRPSNRRQRRREPSSVPSLEGAIVGCQGWSRSLCFIRMSVDSHGRMDS